MSDGENLRKTPEVATITISTKSFLEGCRQGVLYEKGRKIQLKGVSIFCEQLLRATIDRTPNRQHKIKKSFTKGTK